MKIFCIFPTVNISKLNFWLVIFIVKNLIWTTLKAIFSIFRFLFALSDSRFSNSCVSANYCPLLTNHTPMVSLFIQLMYKSVKNDWFCGPGSHVLTQMTFFHPWNTKEDILKNVFVHTMIAQSNTIDVHSIDKNKKPFSKISFFCVCSTEKSQSYRFKMKT